MLEEGEGEEVWEGRVEGRGWGIGIFGVFWVLGF